MKRATLARLVLLGPPLAFLLLTFVLPLLRVIWGSVFAPDFTLEFYERMWRTPVYGRVFWITLKLSFLTTVFAALLG